MGRNAIPINLKATSPEGVVMRFKTIREAAEGLGFCQRGIGKAYHAGRNRTGEYRLEWLKPESVVVAERVKKFKEALNQEDCIYCGKPLTKEDRAGDGFTIIRLGEDGYPVTEFRVKYFYEANKRTGLSYPILINAAEKGNINITRRRDKAKYLIMWGRIHNRCFEIRNQR